MRLAMTGSELCRGLVKHRTESVLKITPPYHDDIPGKGSAFRAIFETAHSLNAKACIVVDSDLRSITPEWVELLIKPVLGRDFDFVAPCITSYSILTLKT